MAWTKEQNLAILESGQNIIVSAGAGSGKTAVLTERVITKLRNGIHINELLILTFTKAAAEEMKERIRSAIMLDESLEEELDYIDQAYITTFDSFALSIVKKYHYLLNISKNVSITEQSIIDIQKEKILSDIFENKYGNLNESFERFINDFCNKDDEDLQKQILSLANKIANKYNKEEYLDNYMNVYFSEEYLNEIINEYKKIYFEKVELLKDTMYDASFIINNDYMTKLNTLFQEVLIEEDYDEFIKKINLIVKFPVLTKAADEEKKSRDEIKNVVEDLKSMANNYGDTNKLKENFLKTRLYVKNIIELLKEYYKVLDKYKKENEIYDFQDIALASLDILENNEDARLELKNTFKEIMVDEYQDTNDIQEKFVSLIANNNVYMVGDIKQSIYRFRNANPYIFKNKYDEYSKNNGGLKIDLVKNFRSRDEVLKNINKVFELIMDDEIGGANYAESHKMVYGNEEYINEGNTDYNYDFEILEYDTDLIKPYTKEEVEIFTIANDIKNKISSGYQVYDKKIKKLRNATYSDFVILIDRTSSFDLYRKIFEYEKIPMNLYKDSKLFDSIDMYVFRNILDFIIRIKERKITQQFKYDFTSISRSYLFNIPDDMIFETFTNENFYENDIVKLFQDISDNIHSLTLTEILEQIIDKTKYFEKIVTVGEVEEAKLRIFKLLDIASNLEKLGYDIYDFLEYFDNILDSDYNSSYEVSTSSDSVKIMTIHKSKGLEYHVCYYSGLFKDFNISDLNSRFIYDNKYGIITPVVEDGIRENFIKQLVSEKFYDEEISEKIRLFYVALTRAKEKMILITPKVDGEKTMLDANRVVKKAMRRKYRSFSDILDSIKYYLKDYYKEIDLNEIGITKDYIYSIKKDNTLETSKANIIKVNELDDIPVMIQEKKHFSKENYSIISKEEYKNMKYGTKIHEVLEDIDFINPEYDLIDDEFIKQKVKKFIESDMLKNITDAIIYKEFEFIYEEDNIKYQGSIDLMLEYSDHIDIVDYKLNNVLDDKYKKQLEGYKKYVSRNTNKKIDTYLYSIMNETITKINL